MNALLYLPPTARPFVRFVVGGRDGEVSRLNGVFRFAKLRRESATDSRQSELNQIYAWFNENLKVPPRHVFLDAQGAACWSRNHAGEAML